MSGGLVSGGLVRQARDAVRRLHGAFHECGGTIYGVVVSCEGFVRACRALIERISPQELNEHNRSQILLNPRFARACPLRSKRLCSIEATSTGRLLIDSSAVHARAVGSSAALDFASRGRCAIGVSDESKAISFAFL